MYTVKQIQQWDNTVEVHGQWVPARPINHRDRTLPQRIREAWMVFRGKADALIWPQDQ